MDFQPYRALIGSRLKFWTVPQGLKIHGPWPSSGILDCLRGSPDRRPLEPGSMEWLIKQSLAKPCRGLVIPRSRILDPESGGICVRDPRSGIQKGGGGVTLKTLGLRAPLRGERLDSGFWILPNMARICLFSVSQAPRSRIQPRHTACSVRAAALGIEIV